MRFSLVLLFLFGLLAVFVSGNADFEDNEFAEFEDDSDFQQAAVEEKPKPVEIKKAPAPPAAKNDDFDDDFDGVVEEEQEEQAPAPSKVEPLKFADVPAHFRSNWASYQVEAAILVVMAVYLVNYVLGRQANSAIADRFVNAHSRLLDAEFALVGDDGVSEQPAAGHLQRDTDCTFSLWCSGRVGVSGMLAQLRTCKRQDLVSRVMALFTPQHDKLTLKFDLDANEIDSFVMSIGQRKALVKHVKEMSDLSMFTTERKGAALPASMTSFCEQADSAAALLDSTVVSVLARHEKALELLHISDQFSGPRIQEGETLSRMPETQAVLMATLVLDGLDEEAEAELLQLVFYVLDKARRFRLSKEGKAKADKRRQQVHEAFLKTTHLARQEAAQAKKEEQIRERKQRLLEEQDPDKQRRLEKLEAKREAKAKAPRMKQLKMR